MNVCDISEDMPPSSKQAKISPNPQASVLIGKGLFEEILKIDTYVDKSLLIEKLCNHSFCLINAPRHFCKSTNMDMLKKFFEIEIYKIPANYDTPRIIQYLKEPIIGTRNYKLFKKLDIFQTKFIMHKHFGKYPVVFADFKCEDSIYSLDGAYSFFRKIIHKSFLEHKYLLTSSNLNSNAKRICHLWCDEDSYETLSECRVTEGLNTLSHYLYTHFGTKCVILIDEYDSVILKNMLKIADKRVLDQIIQITIGIMSAVLKDNEAVVFGLVTGISYVADIGWLDLLGNLKSYKFFQNHEFSEFYGLTADEVDDIFERPMFQNIGDDLKAEALRHYSGYFNEDGGEIYSPRSILNFLQTKKIRSYWCQTEMIFELTNIFKNCIIRDKIIDLLEGKTRTIFIMKTLTSHNLLALKKMLTNPLANCGAHSGLLLYFLLEQGYLTTQRETLPQFEVVVKISNEEIKMAFRESLKTYLEICGLDKPLFEECVQIFNDIPSFYKTVEYTEKINTLAFKLGIIFSKYEGKLNESVFKSVMYILICDSQYIHFSEIETNICFKSYRGILDLALYQQENKFGIIIELKYNRNAKEALQQIIDRGYDGTFENETLVRNGVDNILLIGVNLDKTRKVTIVIIKN